MKRQGNIGFFFTIFTDKALEQSDMTEQFCFVPDWFENVKSKTHFI